MTPCSHILVSCSLAMYIMASLATTRHYTSDFRSLNMIPDLYSSFSRSIFWMSEFIPSNITRIKSIHLRTAITCRARPLPCASPSIITGRSRSLIVAYFCSKVLGTHIIWLSSSPSATSRASQQIIESCPRLDSYISMSPLINQ